MRLRFIIAVIAIVALTAVLLAMPLPEAGIGPIPSVGRGVAPTAVVSAETPGEGPSRPRTDEPAF